MTERGKVRRFEVKTVREGKPYMAPREPDGEPDVVIPVEAVLSDDDCHLYPGDEVWEAAPLRALLREWAGEHGADPEGYRVANDLIVRLREVGIEPMKGSE